MKRKIKLWMGNLLTNCNRLIAKYIRLKNHGFSIIANNCCGGMIYHDLGEQFHSPTINLFMLPLDFFIFLENFDEAICTPVNEIEHDRLGEKPDYPLGEIRLRNGENIQIHFRHYTTFDSAKEKWENRCKRMIVSGWLPRPLICTLPSPTGWAYIRSRASWKTFP